MSRGRMAGPRSGARKDFSQGGGFSCRPAFSWPAYIGMRAHGIGTMLQGRLRIAPEGLPGRIGGAVPGRPCKYAARDLLL